MKRNVCFLCIIGTLWIASSIANAQNVVLNPWFVSYTEDTEVVGLHHPEHWELIADSKTASDGTAYLRCKGGWLPDGAPEGAATVGLWANASYSCKLVQELTNLEPGSYTLTAQAGLGGANSYFLYCKVGDVERTVEMAENNNFAEVIMSDIVIADGSCSIGFTANSNGDPEWMNITDFRFEKSGPVSINSPTESAYRLYREGGTYRLSSDKVIAEISIVSTTGATLFQADSLHGELQLPTLNKGVSVLRFKVEGEHFVEKLTY